VSITRNTLISLTTVDQFEELLRASHTSPVVVFKHSTTCGTSAQAYDEVEEFLHAHPETTVHILDVWSGRALSQHVAKALGVRHESPQLLVISDGAAVWHASHFRASAQSLRAALDSLTAGRPA
jgi:bacillithiol system protein YtxJ